RPTVSSAFQGKYTSGSLVGRTPVQRECKKLYLSSLPKKAPRLQHKPFVFFVFRYTSQDEWGRRNRDTSLCNPFTGREDLHCTRSVASRRIRDRRPEQPARRTKCSAQPKSMSI